MRKFIGLIACLFSVFLAACESSTSKTAPPDNLSFDSYIFGCTFQHPKEWQVGYAFDSGGVALMISDVDPLDVFSYANRTGNEIAISLMGGGEVDPDFVPATFLVELGKEPISSKVYEFNEGDKQFAYVLNGGDLRAALAQTQKGFWFWGDYPLDQESLVQDGIETILRSFELLELGDWELSAPFGQRNEGILTKGLVGEGYIPFAAMSVWRFEGEAGQFVLISVEAGDPEAYLKLDMIDQDGQSIFSEGPISFTNNFSSKKINLRDSGIYTIQVSPSLDMKWWGWYSIKLQ